MVSTMMTSVVASIVTAEMTQAGAIMAAMVTTKVMAAAIVMPSKMSSTIMSLLVTKAVPRKCRLSSYSSLKSSKSSSS